MNCSYIIKDFGIGVFPQLKMGLDQRFSKEEDTKGSCVVLKS